MPMETGYDSIKDVRLEAPKQAMQIVSPADLKNAPVEAAQFMARGRQAYREGFEQNVAERKNRDDIRNAQIQRQQQDRALRMQANLDAKMPADASELDYQNLSQYTQLFGEAPQVGSDGRFDMAGAGMRVRAVNAQKLMAAYQGTGKLTPAQEILSKVYVDRNRAFELIDPSTGQIKTEQQLSEGMKDWPAMAPKDAAAAQEQLTGLQQKRANMARALEIVNDPNQKVVGPLYGSKPGKFLVWAAAAAGKDPAQYSSQQELETVVATNILANVSQMKGALSDKDVKFLQGSVPGLNSTPEFWNKFGQQFTAALDREIGNRQKMLRGEAPDLSDLFDTKGNVIAPKAGTNAVPEIPTPGPGAPSVDYSKADKEPQIFEGKYSNSMVLRGRMVTIGGQPGIVMPDGSKFTFPDDARDRILALRSRFGQTNASPAPSIAPTPAPSSVAPASAVPSRPAPAKPLTLAPVAPTASLPPTNTAIPWGALLKAGKTTASALNPFNR